MIDGSHDQAETARQLATLGRIARIAVQDMALRPMLQRIVDTLAAELDWDFVACASIDHERGEFVCEALNSRLQSSISVGYRRALGSGVVGECAQTGLTIDIEDVRSYPNFVDTLGETSSELCVPVIHNGEVLAILNAESRKLAAFRGRRMLLETVAAQVAGVLHAARLLEQLEQANTQLQAAYRSLESSSRLDSLTGVANRRRFDHWLEEADDLARSQGVSLSAMLVDVDHFKAYNDGYGHLAGDACLRQVAARLAQVLEDSPARLARYGGEEFAVVASGLAGSEVRRLAEKMREAVEAERLAHRHAPAGIVTVSIGVALQSEASLAVDALLAAADAALYDAKRAGRNQVRFAADG